MSLTCKVPELRFKEFIGEWEEKKLEKLSTKISDGIHTTPVYDENGTVFFINGNNLVDGKIEVNKNTKMLNELESLKHKKPLGLKTILLSINGTIGNVAFYNNEKVILGKSACFINIDETQTNKYFINNILKTSKIQRFFYSELTGSTIKNLALSTIKNAKLFIPSKQEQEKIASFLSSVDSSIQKLTCKEKLLQKYKKGIMQKIFSKELRFKDDDGSEFPEWVEKKLGNFGNFYRGHSYNASNVKKEGLLVLRSSNIQNGTLILNKDLQFVNKDCSNNISLQNNDIVICMANGSKHLVGKTGVYYGNYDGKLTVGAFCSIFRASSSFVNYILQSTQYKKYLHILLAGTNINNLKNSELEMLKFILPKSTKEQTKIANFISEIDTKLLHVKEQLTLTKEFKKALLQKMFV